MSDTEQTDGGATAPLTDAQAAVAQAEAEALAESSEKAAEGMKEAAASGQRIAPESSLRLFLSPQHANTTFLVKAGKVVSFRATDSPTGQRDTHRDGDVKARFISGQLATQDPDVIEWCEAHGPNELLHRKYHQERGQRVRDCRVGPGVCCDAHDENATLWVEMKTAQIPTASREATMAPSLNVDNILRGEPIKEVNIGGEGQRLVDAARATQAAHDAAEGDA